VRILPRRLALAALAALTLLAVLAPSALAGSPGRWERVTAPTGVNIDQVGLARTGDGVLHVAWQRKNPATPSNDDLLHTAITPAGAIGAPSLLASDWAGIGNPAILARPDGGLLVIAGAQRSADSSDPILDTGSWSSADGGASWTLYPANAAKPGSFASGTAAAWGSDGMPFFTWGMTQGVFVHRGIGGDSNGEVHTSTLGGCCGYDPGIALDGTTGQLVVGWYSNATGHPGVYAVVVDQASGQPAGAPVLMPGSVTKYAGRMESSASLDRTPVVSRPGKPGVYLAYPGGYPSEKKVVLWRFGAPSSIVLGTTDDRVRDVGIAAAPDGRLWAFWDVETGGAVRVFARRSNPDVSRWGATVRVAAPPKTTSAWKLDGNAQAGVLDLLGSFSTAPSSLATWHTQVRPGLSVAVSPDSLRRGDSRKLTITVTDAGEPVPGAKVTARGRSATTNSKGRATLTVTAPRARSFAVAASKAGYTDGSERVAVKK
jgi:hypothetical protein